MQDIEDKVLRWADDRNILKGSNPEAQLSKTIEEVDELWQATITDDFEEVKDAIGDIMVTLAIQAQMWNTDLSTCFAHAYEQIKDRKGQMVDGVFVKEEA